jgi:hypothetical protein
MLLFRLPLVEAKQTECVTAISCQGYEGSPKGPRKDEPCDSYFKVKVSVVYKIGWLPST